MNVRRSIFAVSTMALLLGGSYFARKASQTAVSEPRLRADGCDPVPLPYPKPTRAGVVVDLGKSSDSSVLADGADPMPLPYPRPTRAFVGASGPADVRVLVADGCDPVPLPYPHRLA